MAETPGRALRFALRNIESRSYVSFDGDVFFDRCDEIWEWAASDGNNGRYELVTYHMMEVATKTVSVPDSQG